MACSSNCPTQDHASWGECVRSKGIRSQWLGGTGLSAKDIKAFEGENAGYRQALKDGLNPQGVDRTSVRRAYEEASAA